MRRMAAVRCGAARSALAARFCDRLVLLADGAVAASGHRATSHAAASRRGVRRRPDYRTYSGIEAALAAGIAQAVADRTPRRAITFTRTQKRNINIKTKLFGNKATKAQSRPSMPEPTEPIHGPADHHLRDQSAATRSEPRQCQSRIGRCRRGGHRRLGPGAGTPPRREHEFPARRGGPAAPGRDGPPGHSRGVGRYRLQHAGDVSLRRRCASAGASTSTATRRA